MTTISIFSRSTKQEDFFDADGNIKNGGCSVTPAVCTCTRELNGTFELYLEIQNSDERTADFLRCWNIISAPVKGRWTDSSHGNEAKIRRKKQLFFIDSVERAENEDGIVTVKVYARHIFYVLSLKRVSALRWKEAKYGTKPFQWVLDYFAGNDSTDRVYNFDATATGGESIEFLVESDTTYAGAILDSGGLVEKYYGGNGGELFRDNFEIYLHRKYKTSKGSTASPAFRFIDGKEICKITESTDCSEVITRLYVISKTNLVQLAVYEVPYEKFGLPAHSVGYFEVDAEDGTDWVTQGKYKAIRFFETVNHPQMSYTITPSPLVRASEYKGMEGVFDTELGDIGMVYSKVLGVDVAQRVTKLTEDVLTGEYTEIVLGNVPGSLSKAYNPTVASSIQAYSSGKKNGGGYSCDVTVLPRESADGNKLTFFVNDLAGRKLWYNAIIDFGDGVSGLASRFYDDTWGEEPHLYAYPGTYKLKVYDCFESPSVFSYPKNIDSGECVSCGLSVGWYTPNAEVIIDNVEFFEGTRKIGQAVGLDETGSHKHSEGLFRKCRTLRNVTIPKSVEYISSYAFKGSSKFDIVYGGTIAEWEALAAYSVQQDKGYGYPYDKLYLFRSVKVTCSDGVTYYDGVIDS